MIRDKDFGLVSGKQELNILRRLNKEVTKVKRQVEDVVLCGNCQHALQRRLSDYFGKYKKINAQMNGNEITFTRDGIKHNIYYLSIGSSSFDGYRFREIYVDSSAVSAHQLNKLTEILKILVAGQLIYKDGDTNATC